MKSRLAQLELLLDNSGIDGNPVISDADLNEMKVLYEGIIDYMDDTGNKLISSSLRHSLWNVISIIRAREFR